MEAVQIRSCQALGKRGIKQGSTGFLGQCNCLTDPVTVDTEHCAFVKAQGMYNSKDGP